MQHIYLAIETMDDGHAFVHRACFTREDARACLNYLLARPVSPLIDRGRLRIDAVRVFTAETEEPA